MSPEPVMRRRDYGGDELDITTVAHDPFDQLQRWLEHAAEVDQGVEPSAMVLSTVSADGRPSSRTVLLRGVDGGRLTFFTNYASRKGADIAANPRVALLFRFVHPVRQVEVLGRAAKLPAADSDAYFATRPRGSQLGAHASPQSQVIGDRSALDRALAEAERRFDGVEVPRPAGWGGYAVTPEAFEFWQGRSSRLHDRLRYTPDGDGGWRIERLAP